MAKIVQFPKPKLCTVVPLPNGMCRLRVDMKIPMAEAIEIIKAMGFLNIVVEPTAPAGS